MHNTCNHTWENRCARHELDSDNNSTELLQQRGTAAPKTLNDNQVVLNSSSSFEKWSNMNVIPGLVGCTTSTKMIQFYLQNVLHWGNITFLTGFELKPSSAHLARAALHRPPLRCYLAPWTQLLVSGVYLWRDCGLCGWQAASCPHVTALGLKTAASIRTLEWKKD